MRWDSWKVNATQPKLQSQMLSGIHFGTVFVLSIVRVASVRVVFCRRGTGRYTASNRVSPARCSRKRRRHPSLGQLCRASQLALPKRYLESTHKVMYVLRKEIRLDSIDSCFRHYFDLFCIVVFCISFCSILRVHEDPVVAKDELMIDPATWRTLQYK